MASSSEVVRDGNCTSSGTGTKRVTDSVTGVWYDPSVGSDDGGEGEEASCLWSISSAYDSSEVTRQPQRHVPCSLDSTWAWRMVSSTSWLSI